MAAPSDSDRVFVSYLTLRRIVGALGVLLPVLLAVGCAVIGSCTELQKSISAYYGTEMRDVLVGTLLTIGFFLFSYKGYERKDDLAGDLAFVFALGTALFPGTGNGTVRVIHLISAAALFLVLAYFSLALFTKSKAGETPTPNKIIRNRIYVTCGVIMLACIVLIAIYMAFLQDTSLSRLKPIFWLEALALWAFGWSWFVKGETLWRDSDQQSTA